MSKAKKCKIGKSHCPVMSSRLAPLANARKAGLVQIVVTNIRTGKERVVGICYKTKANDPGVFLNCCPWCLANIEPK